MTHAWKGVLGAGVIAAILAGGVGLAANDDPDFGLFVQQQLNAHTWELFGILRPLTSSARGPFLDSDSTQAVRVASPLHVSLVSSAAAPNADQIALWPNDDRPTHLFICNESSTTAPAVQRIDLSQPANANATTILSGLTSCDPIRRTAWGTILAGEESTSGAMYEILQPASIDVNVLVTDRAAGTTSDPRVVKRKALGQLAFEGLVILPDGTVYFGDELTPGGGSTATIASGAPGGAIYKFVPDHPLSTHITITDPTESPLASGQLYGLRLGTASPSNSGQGLEIGKGRWIAIDENAIKDGNGNIVLRTAQATLKFTGYYRPEDMDLDPIAWKHDEVRICWADTGRMSNGGGSAVENDATFGEVMCLTDDETADATAATGTIPFVTRFVAGNSQAAMFDNVAFQPHTGNLLMTEDGEVEKVEEDGTTELRGNDVWLCLPDGQDDDVQSDGCIRVLSLRDTSSEPTGPIFTGSGETLYISLQHRGTTPPAGAIIKVTGFSVRDHHDDRDRHDDFFQWHRGR